MAKTPETTQGETQRETATVRVKMTPAPLRPSEEIYVDGVSAIVGRGGVIKLDCYRVIGIDQDNTEIRSVTHRLVLPAGAVPGLVRLFQDMASMGQQLVAETGTGETEAEKKS